MSFSFICWLIKQFTIRPSGFQKILRVLGYYKPVEVLVAKSTNLLQKKSHDPAFSKML